MLHETLEYLGIAFVCSVLLIIMSKIILQALIRRPADYFDAEELRQEELMLNAGGISITNEHETNPEGEIIEETHLEAHLGDITPAEPEEIIPEIPASIHESIEVMDDESEDTSELTEEEEAEEPAEPEAPVEEPAEEPAEPEAPAEEPSEEPAATEAPAEEPSEEPGATEAPSEEPAGQTAEDQFGFSIKAKTSRTPKPRNKEAEEAEEELELARAAIDEAKAHEAASEPVSEWTESYADIRKSLEKAFTDKASAEEKPAERAKPAEMSAAKKRNSGRRRAPSMNMNRKELVQIAESRGIKVPEEATKREILDLIYSDRRKRY